MTPGSLDAIRARDAAADRCMTCGRKAYTSDLDDPYHLLTVEECSRQRGKLRGPCEDPSAHHAYVSGGIRDELCPDEDAAADRRALLAEVDRGCWRWQGALSDEGYGRLPGVRTEYAHRAAYRAFRGPIPADKQVDHLCRNRACVNPDHLELVTRKENILRGVSPSAVNARKTHCIRGHVIDGVNVKGRYCRTCNRDQQRRYRAAGATYPSDARYRHGGGK